MRGYRYRCPGDVHMGLHGGGGNATSGVLTDPMREREDEQDYEVIVESVCVCGGRGAPTIWSIDVSNLWAQQLTLLRGFSETAELQ